MVVDLASLPEDGFECGDLSLSLETREVRFRNTAVHLTATEFAMLELLVLRSGQVITKEMFLSHVYGGRDEPESKIIDLFICKLRRKLNSVGAGGLIGTVWGQGYVVHSRHICSTDDPLRVVVKSADQSGAERGCGF